MPFGVEPMYRLTTASKVLFAGTQREIKAILKTSKPEFCDDAVLEYVEMKANRVNLIDLANGITAFSAPLRTWNIKPDGTLSEITQVLALRIQTEKETAHGVL